MMDNEADMVILLDVKVTEVWPDINMSIFMFTKLQMCN